MKGEQTMVKIIDKRGEHNFLFSQVKIGQVFFSPTYSSFMLKIENCGCDECEFLNAVNLSTGGIYEIESTEVVEPCQAEIQIFNC